VRQLPFRDVAPGDLARRKNLRAGICARDTSRAHSNRPAKTRKRGTKVTFKPDAQIFTETSFSFDKLSERLREKAFLNKGIRITIKDEREEPERSHEFYYKGGIAEFVKHLNKNKTTLHDKPIYFEKESDSLAIEVAIQYNDAYDEKVYSFANNINTVDGGTHLSGFGLRLRERLTPMRSRRTGQELQRLADG
jgi:DNA gyrase subunit B